MRPVRAAADRRPDEVGEKIVVGITIVVIDVAIVQVGQRSWHLSRHDGLPSNRG